MGYRSIRRVFVSGYKLPPLFAELAQCVSARVIRLDVRLLVFPSLVQFCLHGLSASKLPSNPEEYDQNNQKRGSPL